jgi:hypothetical protein
VPVLPSWLAEPLWEQFAALLPERPAYDPTHPLGCHRRRAWTTHRWHTRPHRRP